MAVPVSVMPLPVVVELVNGWGCAPRVEAAEHDEAYPPRPNQVAAWLDDAALNALSNATLAAVADQLHPVFAAIAPDERAALLNRLLQLVQLRPAVLTHHGQVTGAWSVGHSERALLGSAVVALWTEVATGDRRRLGTCASQRCVDVYVDTSPGQRRRFCSVTCQNRTRVAAYRERHASQRHH